MGLNKLIYKNYNDNSLQRRKKMCSFCADKITRVDFKDNNRLKKYITERGKILPSRINGNCAFHQRSLTKAIKCARQIMLMPFTAEG